MTIRVYKVEKTYDNIDVGLQCSEIANQQQQITYSRVTSHRHLDSSAPAHPLYTLVSNVTSQLLDTKLITTLQYHTSTAQSVSNLLLKTAE